MESKNITHFLYMPLTGLGLYGGHRGNRWLKNRLKIFKQFVVPSILNQTNKNFILWVSVRPEERNCPIIAELKSFLEARLPVVFTYSGVCFWDDKYNDEQASRRLAEAIHGASGDLINVLGESSEVLMTIQPSDDCYHSNAVEDIQQFFSTHKDVNVYGYKKGYVMDYINGRLCEWNPGTTPPFYTIRFSRETFVEPYKHMKYTGPYKSHEYVKDFLKAEYVDDRKFIVGTHGENISTVFDHPFAGHEFLGDNILTILKDFGLQNVGTLKLKWSFRKWFMRQLPYGWRRKVRYYLGERFGNKVYNWLRS